jgi:hypothetical protein
VTGQKSALRIHCCAADDALTYRIANLEFPMTLLAHFGVLYVPWLVMATSH